jgi:hypothetical protein
VTSCFRLLPSLLASRALLAAALVLGAPPLGAQTDSVVIPRTGRSIDAFVPKGYFVLLEAKGSLNGDSLPDAVLIVGEGREKADTLIEDLASRIMLVLLGRAVGYELAVRNDDAVLGKHDGGAFGDPLADLSIERNTIVLDHYGGSAWRWQYVHRFRYQQGQFVLIGRTSRYYHNLGVCEAIDTFQPEKFDDVNYNTGMRHHYEVPEDKCVKRERTTRIAKRPMTRLADFDVAKDAEAEDESSSRHR